MFPDDKRNGGVNYSSIFIEICLLVAFEYLIHILFGHVGCHRADNQYDGEAANHGDGTTVDRIDGVAKETVRPTPHTKQAHTEAVVTRFQ